LTFSSFSEISWLLLTPSITSPLILFDEIFMEDLTTGNLFEDLFSHKDSITTLFFSTGTVFNCLLVNKGFKILSSVTSLSIQ